MAYRILSPVNSFVQFDANDDANSCSFPPIPQCLPVYHDSDVAFQFAVAADTQEEADQLCANADGPYDLLTIGLTSNCIDFDILLPKPERFRMDETHVLFNFKAGFVNFQTVYNPMDCFRVLVTVAGSPFCSNCFYRIPDICYTTALEYSNNDNFAGFNYCSGGTSGDSGPTVNECDEQIVNFSNQANLVIPYTTSLQDRFGQFPTVQVWIYDTNGELVDMGIRAALDSFPPTEIRIDFGGSASGYVVIK